MRFSPHTINPDFRRQITISNLCNAQNDLMLSVQANITDQYRVTFHSLFYSMRAWARHASLLFCSFRSRLGLGLC